MHRESERERERERERVCVFLNCDRLVYGVHAKKQIITQYFIDTYFVFRFFKKGGCQLLAKVCARGTG